jgi:lysophospholipase L1-like esterase
MKLHVLALLMMTSLSAVAQAQDRPVRILCVGDSITRGTYLAQYDSGPRKEQGIGLPNPQGGGYRKYLQDKLRAAGIPFEFVGELDYQAYGHDGVVDPGFSPRHHGLAGFGNTGILQGGVVPTPKDVLESKGVAEIRVSGIVEVLEKHKPDVVLLMSGANGFDAKARDQLIGKIVENFKSPLLVATIPPQKAPRVGWEKTAEYNASLPETINRLNAAGAQVQMVDVFHAVQESGITDDGVHPNAEGQKAIATAFFGVLEPTLRNLKLK